MVLGTPSYMSPEQLAGKKIDGRSDLFSLGVTLYQMCCGQLPFTGESLAQLMFRIANEAPAGPVFVALPIDVMEQETSIPPGKPGHSYSATRPDPAGIAAMALAIGVAIDSNVLINERIREELRSGVSPQAAIHTGYERAWATILDSNVTTLIAGLALLAFGSGPVRGFAVVHCIGILTSMFSAVFFSRGL
eukprot:gene1106-1470_t